MNFMFAHMQPKKIEDRKKREVIKKKVKVYFFCYLVKNIKLQK